MTGRKFSTVSFDLLTKDGLVSHVADIRYIEVSDVFILDSKNPEIKHLFKNLYLDFEQWESPKRLKFDLNERIKEFNCKVEAQDSVPVKVILYVFDSHNPDDNEEGDYPLLSFGYRVCFKMMCGDNITGYSTLGSNGEYIPTDDRMPDEKEIDHSEEAENLFFEIRHTIYLTRKKLQDFFDDENEESFQAKISEVFANKKLYGFKE